MPDDTIVTAARIRTHLLPVLRIGSAGILPGAGASKFLTYGRSVQFFTTLGLPVREILVAVVGSIELVAALLLLPDRWPRIAALLVIPVVRVAAATAGPTWQNLGVLTAALLLIGFETTADTDADATMKSTP